MMTKKEEGFISEDSALIQLIVFLAGKEEFGVPIDVVREIIKMSQITPLPTAPEFIKGIINVRGEIVTAIDVKLRFSLPIEKEVESKHIIVTKQEEGLFGLIVDEVIEVLRIHHKDIKPTPSIVTQVQKKYVSGIVTHNDRLIILLDLSKVLSPQDLMYPLSQKNKKRNENNNKEIKLGPSDAGEKKTKRN